MIKFTKNKHPRCVASVHRFMGDHSCCLKYAAWIVNGIPDFNGKPTSRPYCWDCISKVLINLGDKVDDITFDTIVIVKD